MQILYLILEHFIELRQLKKYGEMKECFHLTHNPYNLFHLKRSHFCKYEFKRRIYYLYIKNNYQQYHAFVFNVHIGKCHMRFHVTII